MNKSIYNLKRLVNDKALGFKIFKNRPVNKCKWFKHAMASIQELNSCTATDLPMYIYT